MNLCTPNSPNLHTFVPVLAFQCTRSAYEIRSAHGHGHVQPVAIRKLARQVGPAQEPLRVRKVSPSQGSALTAEIYLISRDQLQGAG